MINDIKHTDLNIKITPAKDPVTRPALDTKPVENRDDVTVNPHLNQLATALAMADNDENTERTELLRDLKFRIDNNEYAVNLDSLAKHLSESSLIN